MKLFALIFLIFSMSLHAHENCDQNPLPELNDILELEKAIQWLAADDHEIKTAHCSRQEPFSDEEMENWLNNNNKSGDVSETINGISFENETPENLNTFRMLTSKLDDLDRPIASQTRNYNSQCKNVNCALKQIFGETGTQLQFLHQKFGFNGSHLAYDEAAPWKKNDLSIVMLAITDYPDGIFPQSKNRQLIHAAPGTGTKGNYADATITVFDLWDTTSPEQKRATIFHELAHDLAFMTDIHDDKSWKDKSGWESTTEIVNGKKVTRNEAISSYTIVSKYGMTSPWEDFAESAIAYRYAPKSLQKIDPDKFAFMKKFVFDNVEYTSQVACSQPKRASADIKRRAEELANAWVPTPAHLQAISKNCSSTVLTELAQRGTISLSEEKFNQCYQTEISKFSEIFIKTQLKDNPDKKFIETLIKNTRVDFSTSKIQSIVTQARQHHTQTLRSELLRTGSDPKTCAPHLKEYTYMRYNEKILGIDTLTHKETMNKVSHVLCTTLQKHSPADTISGMLK